MVNAFCILYRRGKIDAEGIEQAYTDGVITLEQKEEIYEKLHLN